MGPWSFQRYREHVKDNENAIGKKEQIYTDAGQMMDIEAMQTDDPQTINPYRD